MIVILGVCGKLMAGIALLAAKQGHQVLGYDRCFEPPMSEVLRHKNIQLKKGYPSTIDTQNLTSIIVGNQMRRSDPVIQFLVEQRIKLYSGPEWLLEHILRDRTVIAVSGCHGKTTTTSMIAWVLQSLNLNPGYLIGGVHPQLGTAELGQGLFVIEADEYDTAFFDKRPKFLHYWPQYLVLNSVEYDHADIFPSFKEMLQQYQYLLRLLPASGNVFSHQIPMALQDQISAFGINHHQCTEQLADAFSHVPLKVIGAFNRMNALIAKLVCREFICDDPRIDQALSEFQSTHRRQAIVHQSGYTIIDDFAHHPTAISQMIQSCCQSSRVHVVYHPATYTQRIGVMDNEAIEALSAAFQASVLLPPKHHLNIKQYQNHGMTCWEDSYKLVQHLKTQVGLGDTIIVMSAYYLETLLQQMMKEITV